LATGGSFTGVTVIDTRRGVAERDTVQTRKLKLSARD